MALKLDYFDFVSAGSTSSGPSCRTLFTAVDTAYVFSSDHPYRLAHLRNHACFPHDDDIEGAAAKRTLLEGVIF